jgi:hypothetical protein
MTTNLAYDEARRYVVEGRLTVHEVTRLRGVVATVRGNSGLLYRVGNVHAVAHVGRRPAPRTTWLPTDRVETEQVRNPQSVLVTVQRNLELGVTRIVP